MHCEMKRSPSGFAKDVNASAAKRSPNLPFCVSAMLPIDILFNVESSLDRPVCDVRGIGTKKSRNRITSSNWGTKSHAWTNLGSPLVTTQKNMIETAKGMVWMVANR